MTQDRSPDKPDVVIPYALLNELAEVHRGWCNYCKGEALACEISPAGACALRDVSHALRKVKSATTPSAIAPTERIAGAVQEVGAADGSKWIMGSALPPTIAAKEPWAQHPVRTLHGCVETLARAFKGYLPWPDELRTQTVRGHEMLIEDTVKRADACMTIIEHAESVRSAIASKETWRCEGCGELFDQYRLSHGRAQDDGKGNAVEVECGPISRTGRLQNDD